MKMTWQVINGHLNVLYNLSMKSLSFSNGWKNANLVLIPKEKDKDPSLIKSYKLLSLLNVLSKVLETLIIKIIESEIAFNMSEDQYGFIKGRSTIIAMDSLRTWVKECNSRHVFDALIDISEAFDNVKWITILQDLAALGASYESLALIRSYLTNRIVSLTMEDTMLTRSAYGGCPRGSRLGPTIWNIAMDAELRIPCDNNIKVIAYAGDIAILAGAATVESATDIISKFYKKINDWACYRWLNLAMERTQTITLKSDKKPGFLTELDGQLVAAISPATYLGIHIDSK